MKLADFFKDKDLAKDILVAELRSSYDTTKAENIKLSDSLETQQKLWKIWVEKFEIGNKKQKNDEENDTELEVEDKKVEHIYDVDVVGYQRSISHFF